MSANFLSPNCFTVSIARLPTVEFLVQSVTIPDVESSSVSVPTPLSKFYEQQDTLDYSDLSMKFVIDEDMKNYVEVFDWLRSLSPAERSQQFGELKQSEYGTESDISIIITDSNKNPKINFTFLKCFPTSLSSFELNLVAESVDVVTATVTFRYDRFTVSKL